MKSWKNDQTIEINKNMKIFYNRIRKSIKFQIESSSQKVISAQILDGG